MLIFLGFGVMVFFIFSNFGRPLEKFAGFFLEKILNPSARLTNYFSVLKDRFQTQGVLKKENELLKNQLQESKAKFNNYDFILQENQELKNLLKFKQNYLGHFEVVPAEVLASSPSNWFSTVLINQGQAAGITEGQAVLNEAGIVGRILETNQTTSLVLLITDPTSAESVGVLRNSLEAVAAGQLGRPLLLKYVLNSADILPGDEVVTSERSNFFPAGFKIGTVIKIIKKEKELFSQILVKPSVDFTRLNKVFVILR